MSVHGMELKVVILGVERTGKTALVSKYIHSSSPTGYDFSTSAGGNRKHISLQGQPFTLNLLTAQVASDSSFCQTGQAFILLDAINNKHSFTQIRQLYKGIEADKGRRLASTPVFLVGTKADLESERQVSLEEARQLAISLRCQKLFEINPLNNTDEIDDLFTKLVRQYLTSQHVTMDNHPPMTPVPSTPQTMSSAPASPSNDGSPRRSSVLERLKLGSLKRKASVQSLVRKKSTSFSESIMSLGSARPSRDNVRNVSYGTSSTMTDTTLNGGRGYYNNVTVPRRSSPMGSPYRLDVNTSAWRDTIKWPTEIIPEEDLLANGIGAM